jgi:hypothetical protein
MNTFTSGVNEDFSTELNQNFTEVMQGVSSVAPLHYSLLDKIRGMQLGDVYISKGGLEPVMCDAYTTATGRRGTVITGETTAGFSTNKYTTSTTSSPVSTGTQFYKGSPWTSDSSEVFSCSWTNQANAFDLNSEVTNATIAGSGNIKTTVTKKIKAKVVGSGNIYYSGNPAEKEVKSVGSGKIIHQN